MSDRIKLAEAMGWKFVPATASNAGPVYGKLPATPSYWIHPNGCRITRGEYTEHEPPFDPWRSANDDHEVLLWMRNWRFSGISEYGALDGLLAANYKIGDYARAAVLVSTGHD